MYAYKIKSLLFSMYKHCSTLCKYVKFNQTIEIKLFYFASRYSKKVQVHAYDCRSVGYRKQW